MFEQFLRKKTIDSQIPSALRQCLTTFDLIFLGIGAIIGAGIFILTGVVAATKAGPAIVLSFLVAGIACGCSALAYAELSAAIGGCGSAYSYAYAGLGELIAWIIGWDLLLEYGFSCSTVAIGWAGYANNVLQAFGLELPHYLVKGPFEGGIINVMAMLILFIITTLLILGVKYSSRFNTLIVFVKLFAIGTFIVVAIPHLNYANWQPYLPFGWQGVINGASVIFFAYIGFDAVSTTAEEAINPQKSLPIGILVSLVICTFIYVVVSALLTGIYPFSLLNVSSPVSHVLLALQHPLPAGIIAIGAVAGLTTVILVMYYGFTRVFLAMARDGLLPGALAWIHPITQTPVRIIAFVGVLMMLIAGILPIAEAAELVNIGTLSAFFLVSIGVVILRYTQPDLKRPFVAPLSPYIPILGAVLSLYLMISLSAITWYRFFIWLIIGLFVYFGYSIKNSKLNNSKKTS